MRLFIAIPLPHEVETRLGEIIKELRAHDGSVKWVEPSNIHLTLRFLGETGSDRVSAIKSALQKIAEKHHSIDTRIDKIGGFPNLKRPRVIWCGMSVGFEALGRIAQEVEDAMVAIGFAGEEKPFKAHLTLGRVREGANVNRLADYLADYVITPIPLCLDSIVLFKSTLTPRGPVYERLAQFALGNSDIRLA